MLESTDVMQNWNNQVSLFRFQRVIFSRVKGNASVTEYSFYSPYIAIICSTPNVLLVKQFHIFEAVIHETNETVNINSLKLRLYFDIMSGIWYIFSTWRKFMNANSVFRKIIILQDT